MEHRRISIYYLVFVGLENDISSLYKHPKGILAVCFSMNETSDIPGLLQRNFHSCDTARSVRIH